MSETSAITSGPPPRKGRPILAWLVILAVVGFILWRARAADPGDKQAYDLVNVRLQGRYLVGVAEFEDSLLGMNRGGRVQLYQESQKTLNRGTYPQRLRFVVLAGELQGAEEAREQLLHIDRRYHECVGDPPAQEGETARLLDRLYAIRLQDPKKPVTPLSEEERGELRRRLGWFGDLALAPAGDDDAAARAAVLAPAYRTAVSLMGVACFMLGGGAVGLAFLVVLVVLYCLGKLRGGVAPGSPHHGVYAETFALYMLLFLGFGFAARYALRWFPLQHGTIALSGVVALSSLAALAWPVLRGIPWRQVRQDIGWNAGRRPWLEPLYGIGCYLLALPMLLVGVLLTVLLTKLRDEFGWGPEEFGPSNAPGHPILLWVASARWWVWVEVVFMASFVAPLVEETMFRGILYRHLRDASRRLRPWSSVLVSALLVSFLFAVIHPQGFLGVPPLMALALAFTLMREWRGTLLPPMIAHGINNGVTTLMLGLMMT